MGKKAVILVATHKDFKMPTDRLYLPILVGADFNNISIKGRSFVNNYGDIWETSDLIAVKDNAQDNISKKNPYYCELTAIYWAWKNMDVDYIGLCHYRRYFLGLGKRKPSANLDVKQKFNYILSKADVEKIFEKYDVILPRKRHIIVDTVYNHWKHTLPIEPLEETGKIISEICPEYSFEFDKSKKRRSMHGLNMFVMRKDIFDSYCEWLFPILEELEKRIDMSGYNDYQKRIIGMVSERLLDVYLYTSENNLFVRGGKILELAIVEIEKINYKSKLIKFARAKFLGKIYE